MAKKDKLRSQRRKGDERRKRSKERQKMREPYQTRVIPVHVRKADATTYPFMVAYDMGGRFLAGARLTADDFYDVLEDYDAVIVHWKDQDRDTPDNQFLLYGVAGEIDVSEDDVTSRTKRKRSVEVAGDLRWFHHGKGLAVDTSLGLHCLDRETWDDLP